ncbi:rhamnogalacturonan lyase [Pedobacter sp. MW01-1-1]|uniref:rhamnogalacturonan lyase n=1 Tax=Pedobacter sp. MW01-1-1 TaxID=3383027 RepID=UPI003FEF687C
MKIQSLISKVFFLAIGLIFVSEFVFGQREMEYLDRGVVVIHQPGDSAFVSWRILGTEPDNISFNLYRKTSDQPAVKLNAKPLQGATIFTDKQVDFSKKNSWFVRSIQHNKESEDSKAFVLAENSEAKPYLSIPLKTLPGYSPNDCSVGDLDGDGEYEIILHQTGRSHDNSHAGFTSEPLLEAYKLDGTFLWRINLGKNIREGAHYTQFMVYDLDGDGKAEIACKTADGTMDGKGKIIGDSTKDWRNKSGYILAGPEYLTVFNGLTGAELYTTDFNPPRFSTINPSFYDLKNEWGDGYGNRMDRFLAAIAYLDGKHPSLIMSRGYYTKIVITAWDFKDGKLEKRWVFDTEKPGNKKFAGQGNHNLSITDVDGDGKDEIVFGAMTIDDDGKGLYSTGFGHGDAIHVGDLDPDRPGLEVFDIQERFDDAGAHLTDAATGKVLWKLPSVKAGEDGEGPGRGLALNIDPRYRGSECWVAGAGITGMYDIKGNKIQERTPSVNFGIFWDGDCQSELLNSTNIDKWDYLNAQTSRLLNARMYNCVSNNGTKSNPCLSADIFGDWREEVIYRTADNQELRIFTSTIPTSHRFYTFMHDPQYRLSIAWQNVGYNQPPHTSFYMGDDMEKPPLPHITLIKSKPLK